MTRFVVTPSLLLAVVAASAGCFYVDGINQRPSLDIRTASSDPVYRGGHVDLTAIASDPEDHYISFAWRVQACSDATSATGCDQVPFYTEILKAASFDVPIVRMEGGLPIQSLRVVLEAQDELGASAKPSQELVIPVLNAPPTLQLSKTSRYGYVSGTPIDLFALVGDTDDGAAQVQPLQWEVFAPGQLSHTLDELAAQPAADPKKLQFGKRFTPAGAGEWEIRVTATDPLGAMTLQTLMITVMSDTPPCFAQLLPIVPTGGATLPITEPTLFRVPVVIDDLDVYPPVPADPVLKTTTFRWSLQAPGQVGHVELVGVVGNSYALDPSTYTPGDVVELRVEILDRLNIDPAVQCPAADLACSVISQPTCTQRQTWRVEAR